MPRFSRWVPWYHTLSIARSCFSTASAPDGCVDSRAFTELATLFDPRETTETRLSSHFGYFIMFGLRWRSESVSMARRLNSALLTALPFVGAIFILVGAADLSPRLGYTERPSLSLGAVLVHRAIKYDVSRPLALMRESNDGAAAADCEGLACGTSPSESSEDPDDAQE